MRVISLFSGCGGLDLGFERQGFDVVWACETNKAAVDTYKRNFPDCVVHDGDIRKVDVSKLPENVDGIIGGPPCQAWSIAGAMRGFDDDRGLLFREYMRIVESVRPKFFVAENVAGITNKAMRESFTAILDAFGELGYTVYHKTLNASSYGVPQDRKRVFVVGIRTDVHTSEFVYQSPATAPNVTLAMALEGLGDAIPSNGTKTANPSTNGHEYITEEACSFSSQFMSRNRVRQWTEVSFTIPASGKHVPLHPSTPKMTNVRKDVFHLESSSARRLSVRECARIQSFPDDFELVYKNIMDGYKMIGNAVPVGLAECVATSIRQYF